jgi:hypothetical protein
MNETSVKLEIFGSENQLEEGGGQKERVVGVNM